MNAIPQAADMSKSPRFELGDLVRFLYEPGKQFVIVRRDYRPYSGNWHYLLRGDKWRIEDDLSLATDSFSV